MKFRPILLAVGIISGLMVFPILYLIQSTPSDPPDQEFLRGFHTGTCLLDAYDPNSTAYDVWTPARLAGVLKFGVAGERNATINEDGSVTDGWTDEAIHSSIEQYLSQGIVPIVQFIRLYNFENVSETAVRNFLINMAGWINASGPDKFVIWNPAAEFNFPDGMQGWSGQKIDYRDFFPQMKMIQRVRNELGLQHKVVIGIHANLLVHYQTDADGSWHFQDYETGFIGIDEYIEGFAHGDIFGVSHYLGYKNPEYNPLNLTWQETLQKSWKRSRIIWQKVCERANRTLPFYFFEYSVGSVWKFDQDPMWKEAVTHTYTQMVHNNKWVKGLGWYTGPFFELDAMQELVSLASVYDGYGIPPPLISDANRDDIVDILDLTIVDAAFGSEPGDPRWSPVADVGSDGIVDVFDLQIVTRGFGESARVFCDGFEDCGFEGFTGTTTLGDGALECQSLVKHFGNYAQHAYAASSAWSDKAWTYFDSPQTLNDSHYIRVYIRFANIPDTHGDYANFVRVHDAYPYPTTIWRCALSYIADRCYLEMYTPHGSSNFLYYDFSDIDPTKWYVVEFGYKKHATEGFYRIYVDGVLEASDENVDTSSDPDAVSFRFGLVGGGGTWGSGLPNVYIDLAAVDTEHIGPAIVYE